MLSLVSFSIYFLSWQGKADTCLSYLCFSLLPSCLKKHKGGMGRGRDLQLRKPDNLHPHPKSKHLQSTVYQCFKLTVLKLTEKIQHGRTFHHFNIVCKSDVGLRFISSSCCCVCRFLRGTSFTFLSFIKKIGFGGE